MTIEHKVRPLAVAFAAATIAACGGGGGGGGGGSSDGGDGSSGISLSGEEQATVAAKNAAEIGTSAVDLATLSEPSDTSDDTTSGAITGGHLSECIQHRNTTGVSVDFPEVFSGDATGERDEYVANDCEYSGGSIDGQLQITQDGDTQDRKWVVFRSGGVTGMGNDPDLSGAYMLEASGDGFSMTLESTAEMFACSGCTGDNPTQLNGVADIDVLVAAYADWKFDNDRFELGDGRNDKFVMKSEHVTGTVSAADVTVDGRMAFMDGDNEGCGFDVSYNFANFDDSTPLRVNDLDSADPQVVGGKFQLTVNDTSETYTVEISGSGDVTVFDDSGASVEVDDEEVANTCPDA